MNTTTVENKLYSSLSWLSLYSYCLSGLLSEPMKN